MLATCQYWARWHCCPPSATTAIITKKKFEIPSTYFLFFLYSVLIQEDNTSEPPQSVQRGVTELVEAALNPKNLCMMDPTWHPWF